MPFHTATVTGTANACPAREAGPTRLARRTPIVTPRSMRSADHAAAGRLESDELDERLETALRARTLGDLRPLVADLRARAVPRSASGAPRTLARPRNDLRQRLVGRPARRVGRAPIVH